MNEDISDIEIISVMTDKLTGGDNDVGGWLKSGWNYSTDWRTVDTTASNKTDGNWISREIITGWVSPFRHDIIKLLVRRQWGDHRRKFRVYSL